MPAIITHDTFGRDVYRELFDTIGESRDELDAFLLGNQGPDVLFYGAVNPRVAWANALGSRMHRESPTRLLSAFAESAWNTPDDIWFAALAKTGGRPAWNPRETPTASARSIAVAYMLGLLCHYELDSKLHPFIYAQQWALCDAGVDGLDRGCAHEVHATIESELDELVLTVKRNETIATFDPSERILGATNHVLDVISALYFNVVREVFGMRIAPDAFRVCVKSFRQVQRLMYSSTGMKRHVIGSVETLFRRYSFLRALSHRNVRLHESIFDNREHEPWTNPETGAVSHMGFWDLYDLALIRAESDLPPLAAPPKGRTAAATEQLVRRITDDLDFNGAPATARIIAAETVE